MAGKDTRPTSELVRESLFNILGTDVVGRLVFDLFAGTGALGLEALGGFTKPNLKMGDGVAAGVSIVLLALILDRLTQAWGNRSAPENRRHCRASR